MSLFASRLRSLTNVTARRWYWQEVVRCKTDPRTGKLRYEKPHQAAMRAAQGIGNSDRKREELMVNYKEYEKPWMRRKRKKDERIYGRKKTKVNELIRYVKFMEYVKTEK